MVPMSCTRKSRRINDARKEKGMAVNDGEIIYQNLPEEQKQAFDYCIDLGQVKEAGEILAGQEREKKSRH